jgi:hypothetical protein
LNIINHDKNTLHSVITFDVLNNNKILQNEKLNNQNSTYPDGIRIYN